MKIVDICNLLRNELYENGYEYGFYWNGIKYKPDINNGFDSKYYNLSQTIYRIQDPIDTMREKIGTCIDAVMVMKFILDGISVKNKIWLLYQKNKYHTIATFSAEGKIIYLELTPQSSKPFYAKEIIYNNERDFIAEYQKNNYVILDVTGKIVIGTSPNALLEGLDS